MRDVGDFARSPAVFAKPAEIAAISPATVKPAFIQHAESAGQQNLAAMAKLLPKQYILIGDLQGKVHVCDASNYVSAGSFTAFSDKGGVTGQESSGSTRGTGRVTHISCDDKGRAITVGEDDGAKFPILRIWDLHSVVASSTDVPAPRLLAEAKVQHGSKPNPVRGQPMACRSSADTGRFTGRRPCTHADFFLPCCRSCGRHCSALARGRGGVARRTEALQRTGSFLSGRHVTEIQSCSSSNILAWRRKPGHGPRLRRETPYHDGPSTQRQKRAGSANSKAAEASSGTRRQQKE